MGANIAGIYGAQIFRQDDRPRYRRGFAINIGVLALGLSLAIIRYVDDRIQRRRKRNRVELETADGGSHDDNENEEGVEEVNVRPQKGLVGEGDGIPR